MKRVEWDVLASLMQGHGFNLFEQISSRSTIAWFGSGNVVSTWFKFEYKPKLQVLTVNLGWRHEAAQNFCIHALARGWPKGYSWLAEVGLIDAPCLSVFNLGEWLEYPLAGMPVGPDIVYANALKRFDEKLTQNSWMEKDVASLLDTLLGNDRPTGWRDGNAAIRLAEIAGLISFLGGDVLMFDKVAQRYAGLVQADMFSLGLAEDWIGYLRSAIQAA